MADTEANEPENPEIQVDSAAEVSFRKGSGGERLSYRADLNNQFSENDSAIGDDL